MLLRLTRPLSALFLSSSLLLTLNLPAHAAERVTLSYGGIQDSITVADLADFAETGQPSAKLAAYLLLTNRQPEELRDILTRSIPMESSLLSSALNSFVGDLLLNQVDDVVINPDGNSRDALRTALIESAATNNRLTLLEVLQNHPADDVQIDGDRLVQFIDQLQSLYQGISDFGL
ncbi:MAG: alpha/beta hydrolase [Spirulinaceae cyanobacterium RM2_2_10]|nr:alpha/beta hydrolase [Spirulinaceae cyanobacterium SM2_1_0]NJO19409.1 alpha/beta hydrolase [Spirulinaceae cyanobacterium RM2_2_10]